MLILLTGIAMTALYFYRNEVVALFVQEANKYLETEDMSTSATGHDHYARCHRPSLPSPADRFSRQMRISIATAMQQTIRLLLP